MGSGSTETGRLSFILGRVVVAGRLPSPLPPTPQGLTSGCCTLHGTSRLDGDKTESFTQENCFHPMHAVSRVLCSKIHNHSFWVLKQAPSACQLSVKLEKRQGSVQETEMIKPPLSSSPWHSMTGRALHELSEAAFLLQQLNSRAASS